MSYDVNERFERAKELLPREYDISADMYIDISPSVPSPYQIKDVAEDYGRYQFLSTKLISQTCILNGFDPNDTYFLPVYIIKEHCYPGDTRLLFTRYSFRFDHDGKSWGISFSKWKLLMCMSYLPIDIFKCKKEGDYIHIKTRVPVRSITCDGARYLYQSDIPNRPIYIDVNMHLKLSQRSCPQKYLCYNTPEANRGGPLKGSHNPIKYDSTLKYQAYEEDGPEPIDECFEDVFEQEYLLTPKRTPKTFDPSSIKPLPTQVVDSSMIPE